MFNKVREVIVDGDKLDTLYMKYEELKRENELLRKNNGTYKENDTVLKRELKSLSDVIDTLNVRLYKQENIEVNLYKKKITELENKIELKDHILSSKNDKINELILTKPVYEKVDIHV